MRSLIPFAIGLALATGCSSPPSEARITSPPPVLSPNALCIYVHGEVVVPGKFAWTNGMTLQDAIHVAGGFTDFAPRKLRVVHNDQSTVYRLGPGWTFTNNPPVQAGDHIYSPRRFF